MEDSEACFKAAGCSSGCCDANSDQTDSDSWCMTKLPLDVRGAEADGAAASLAPSAAELARA